MIRSGVVVGRPIEAVFDYASHFERHPEWQPDLKAADFQGPARVGSTGSETRQTGPRTSTYRWRVSECDPPHRLGFETTSGPMRPAGTMEFRSEGQATRVELTMALNPRGLMRLLAPLVQRQVQQASDEHLILFKQRLESDAS